MPKGKGYYGARPKAGASGNGNPIGRGLQKAMKANGTGGQRPQTPKEMKRRMMSGRGM